MKNLGIRISIYVNYFVFAILLNSVGIVIEGSPNASVWKEDFVLSFSARRYWYLGDEDIAPRNSASPILSNTLTNTLHVGLPCYSTSDPYGTVAVTRDQELPRNFYQCLSMGIIKHTILEDWKYIEPDFTFEVRHIILTVG